MAYYGTGVKMMDKLTVVIKRNASYEDGMYGLSVHNEPGGAANVQPIKSEEELKAKLLEFGATDEYANDILARLKEKHSSVKIDFPAA
jgi:hypothetical protein